MNTPLCRLRPLLIIACWLSCIHLSQASAEETSKSSGSKEQVQFVSMIYPPFSAGDGSGVVVRLINEVLEGHFPTKYTWLPRKRAVHEFKKNDKLIFIGASHLMKGTTHNSIDLLHYSRNLLYFDDHTKIKKGSQLSDLKGRSVALPLDSSSKKELAANGLTLFEGHSQDHVLKMLLTKRVDFAYLPYNPNLKELAARLDPQVDNLKIHTYSKNTIILSSQTTPEAIERLKKIEMLLEQYIASGRYHAFLKEHEHIGFIPKD